MLIASTQFKRRGISSAILLDGSALANQGAYTGYALNAYGSAAIDSVFHGGSLALPGVGSYFDMTGAGINVSSGNYTISAWVYATSATDYKTIFSNYSVQGAGRIALVVTPTGSVEIYEQDANAGNSVTLATAASQVPLNTWTHVEVTKAGTTLRLFVGGVLKATGTSAARAGNTGYARIGRFADPGTYEWPWVGYLDDVKLVVGTALHTTNFTP